MVRIAIYVLLVFFVGCILAWTPVAAVCSLPGVRYSNACGHNVAYWLIVTLPLGWLLAALWVPRLYSKMRRKE
jgi:hypothetical protein